MTARFASLSQRAQVAVVVAALLLVVVVGYFGVISPKRGTAASLKKQTAAVQKQIDQNQSAGFKQALPAVRSAPVFSLAKAMPSQLQTPEVLLQLNQLALDSGISFDSIAPQSSSGSTTADVTDPFAVEPITVQFSGSYYNLLALLQRLRNLVRVENGNLFAAGRLFDVSDIQFCATNSGSCSVAGAGSSVPGSAGPQTAAAFGEIQANLTINAFVPQKSQPLSTTPGGTGTTSTTTGTTTTTSNPTSAAPSTSGGTS